MKANEMRVNNYYTVANEDIKLDNGNLVWYLEGGDEMFKPIPLTEQWLLKFGFVKDGEDYLLINIEELLKEDECWNRDYKMQKELFGDIWYFKYRTNENEIDSPIATIKYIHELQNLYFALTGEELTVK